MAELKAGQVVQLKSGGPEMTLADVFEDSTDGTMCAKCLWFDGTKPMSGIYPLIVLNAIDG